LQSLRLTWHSIAQLEAGEVAGGVTFKMAATDDDTFGLLLFESLSSIVDRLSVVIAVSYSINGAFCEALMAESNDHGCGVFDDLVQRLLDLLLCSLPLA
jgi:hypothetical protein